MIDVVASAPGKIIIAGEYAVLTDAPAVSMAVNRRVRVRITPSGTADHSLKTIGHDDGEKRFRMNPSGIEWLDELPAPDTMSLFEFVIGETGFDPEMPLSVEIDSSALSDRRSGHKLGLGSSAAVAVALSAACLYSDGRAEETSASAARAHRAFQKGRGSGVDIATSTTGGLISYRRNGGTESLAWPPSLEAAILWSGHSASTADRISGLDGGDASTAMRDLADAARETADAWQAGDDRRVLATMARFVDRLTAFDAVHRRGIFEAGHAGLVELASTFKRLVYKPCGAGGGDVGMVFTDTAGDLAAFVEKAEQRGFRSLGARVDDDGVTVEAGAA